MTELTKQDILKELEEEGGQFVSGGRHGLHNNQHAGCCCGCIVAQGLLWWFLQTTIVIPAFLLVVGVLGSIAFGIAYILSYPILLLSHAGNLWRLGPQQAGGISEHPVSLPILLLFQPLAAFVMVLAMQLRDKEASSWQWNQWILFLLIVLISIFLIIFQCLLIPYCLIAKGIIEDVPHPSDEGGYKFLLPALLTSLPVVVWYYFLKKVLYWGWLRRQNHNYEATTTQTTTTTTTTATGEEEDGEWVGAIQKDHRVLSDKYSEDESHTINRLQQREEEEEENDGIFPKFAIPPPPTLVVNNQQQGSAAASGIIQLAPTSPQQNNRNKIEVTEKKLALLRKRLDNRLDNKAQQKSLKKKQQQNAEGIASLRAAIVADNSTHYEDGSIELSPIV